MQDDNVHNNSEVYISREDFKHEELDCFLIQIKIISEQAKIDENFMQKEFESIANKTITHNFQKPL